MYPQPQTNACNIHTQYIVYNMSILKGALHRYMYMYMYVHLEHVTYIVYYGGWSHSHTTCMVVGLTPMLHVLLIAAHE